MPWRRMDHETGRLIEDQEPFVFVHDVEVHIMGPKLSRLRRLICGEQHIYLVAPGEVPGRPAPVVVDPDGALGNQAGGLCARKRKLIGEEPVEPLGGFDRYLEAEASLRQRSAQLTRKLLLDWPTYRRIPIALDPPTRARSPARWLRS